MTQRFALRLARAAAVVGAGFAGLCGSVAPAGAGSDAAPQLRVVASLHPGAVAFGDVVTADVEVDYDPGAIELSSIRVQPSFIPYVATSVPVIQRLGAGAVRFRYSLSCLTDGCLPTRGPRVLRIEPVRVTGLAGTRTVTATASWPVLRISSRLVPSDLSGAVHFRTPTSPPSPEYGLAPGPLSAGLIAAAALCALAAAALAVRGFAGLRRRSTGRPLTPLQLAIAYVRDSARRSDLDRRRALSLLAEAVDENGELSLAAAAAETAWSKQPPTPAGASELADRAADA